MTIKYVGVTPPENKVDKLVFSLGDGGGSISGVGVYDCGSIELLDNMGDSLEEWIAYKDIDNMIEALKLAKELWGDEASE